MVSLLALRVDDFVSVVQMRKLVPMTFNGLLALQMKFTRSTSTAADLAPTGWASTAHIIVGPAYEVS